MPDMDMVRRFAGVTEADDSVLSFCVDAAIRWYAHAGVKESDGPLYDFWVSNLAAWMYDQRGAGGDANIPPYIVQSVHQLRGRGS